MQLDCSGSGNLNWELQSGAAIEVNTGIDPDVNRYQQFDFSNLVQRLIIQVFSEAESDLYTCTSDLLVNGIEGVIATSVLITSGMFVCVFSCNCFIWLYACVCLLCFVCLCVLLSCMFIMAVYCSCMFVC